MSEENVEDKTEISVSELEDLRAKAMQAGQIQEQNKVLAMNQAGLDSSNPVTELVMEKHYTPGMSVEDLKALGERFSILAKQETTSTATSNTPDPNEVLGGANKTPEQEMTDLGQNARPDTHPDKSLKEKMAQELQNSLESGTTREDAEVNALNILFQQNRINAARTRQAIQREDQELLGN